MDSSSSSNKVLTPAETIELCNEGLKANSFDFKLLNMKTKAYLELNDFEEAAHINKITIDKFLQKNPTKSNWNSFAKEIFLNIKEYEAQVLEKLAKPNEALKSINESLEICTDIENKHELLRERTRINSVTVDNFANMLYNQRKVIYVDEADNIPYINPTTFLPIEESVARKIKFPPGHPRKEALYIGHPFDSNTYFPLDEYENLLFESQMLELGRFLQCLGAKIIKTEKTTSSSTENYQNIDIKEKNQSNLDIDAKAKVGIYKGEFSMNKENKSNINQNNQNNLETEIGKKISIDGEFAPSKKPYIPNDLIWFAHSEMWRTLAQQRLDGNVLNMSFVLSTKNVEQVSEKELVTINNEFNLMTQAKLGMKVFNGSIAVDYSKESNKSTNSNFQTKKKESSDIKIYVEFADKKELLEEHVFTNAIAQTPEVPQIVESEIPPQSSPQLSLNDQENEYFEYLDDCFEDGGFPESSLRILNRRREKLGISPDRAKEIEAIYISSKSFTAEEQEYIEDIRFYLEDDGLISDDERRALTRAMSKLGISAERAEELEKFVIAQ